MPMQRRKDSKKRVLREGEYPRKNGTYEYRYTDITGKRKSIYGKTLEELREKEEDINRDLLDGIIPSGNDMTIQELVETYLMQKNNIRDKTRESYNSAFRTLKKEPFVQVRIDKVKVMDAKSFFVKLQRVNGMGYSNIHRMRELLKPAFQMAFENDLIRKNPFQFKLSDVIKKDVKKREALTEEQMNSFLEFIRTNEEFSGYYNGIYVLFHTGLRISEFCGLTKRDIDLKQKIMNVDHQLYWVDGRMRVDTVKTESGTRKIPIGDDVCNCIKDELKHREANEQIIDGYTGFIFLSKRGNPCSKQTWDARFRKITDTYNATHKVQMPNVTPHICRHTFCSNMAKQGMNPKILQYIMGHSDIGITMNVYTHLNFDDVKKEVEDLRKKIAL